MLQLTQVLEQMEKTDKGGNPLPFTVTFVTANTQTEEGGDLVTLKGAVLAQKIKGLPTYAKRAIQQEDEAIKNPKHWENGTRNLWHNERYVKVHIRLITQFNGTKVIY
jgi:hypothetical protein